MAGCREQYDASEADTRSRYAETMASRQLSVQQHLDNGGLLFYLLIRYKDIGKYYDAILRYGGEERESEEAPNRDNTTWVEITP